MVARQNTDAFVDDANLSVNAGGVEEFNVKHDTEWGMVRASWEALRKILIKNMKYDE